MIHHCNLVRIPFYMNIHILLIVCFVCSLHCCSKLGCKVWRGMAVVWTVVGCVRQRMAGAERWAGLLYWYTMVSYW